MNSVDNFERSLKHYKIVSRTLMGFLAALSLSILPHQLLGFRNLQIDYLRNEPLIKKSEDLEKAVQKCQKELKLDNARFDIVTTNNNYPRTFCGMISNNHYVLVFREEDKKPFVVEHEMFHAYEMQSGKLNCDTRKLKDTFSPSYFCAEWRAQNYCLRNHQGNKITSSQEAGMAK